MLSGYTIVVSDNINVKGFKTSAGTESLKDYKPTEDATIVEKLRAEGGCVIGKSLIIMLSPLVNKILVWVRNTFLITISCPPRKRKYS